MEYAVEKKLYQETTLEILYKYMEFILSFDKEVNFNYMTNYPALEEIYQNLKEKLSILDEEPFDSLTSIYFITSFINNYISNVDFINFSDVTKGLNKVELSNLILGLYLKRFKNSIIQQLENIIAILSEYKTTNAKFLVELLSMFKTLNLSTSIKSDIVENNLMPYYAASLGIRYDDEQTSKMYSFMMINLLTKIGETLPLVLSEIGLSDLHINDISGHIDCFTHHKDEIYGSYPIENLAISLGNFKANLELVIEALKVKDDNISLQLGVKNEN